MDARQSALGTRRRLRHSRGSAIVANDLEARRASLSVDPSQCRRINSRHSLGSWGAGPADEVRGSECDDPIVVVSEPFLLAIDGCVTEKKDGKRAGDMGKRG
jgi:hypothetical protein